MKNQIITCLSFSFIFLLSIQALGERIIHFHGFDREDVPNLTVFILTRPELKQIDQKPLPLDVMVGLQQLSNSYNFVAYAFHTDPAFYAFDRNYRLEKLDKTHFEAPKGEARNWSVGTDSTDEVILNVGDKTYYGIPGLYPISATVIDPITHYFYYSANVAEKGINFTKIICYDLDNSVIINETVLKQDTSAFNTAEKIMNKTHQLFLTDDGKLLATVGTGVVYADHEHVND